MPVLLTTLAIGGGGSVQDAGRPGWRRFGVPAGGCMDPVAAALANRLIGNLPGAPVLELHRGGQRFEVRADTALALVGADGPASLALQRAHRARAGTELRLGTFTRGQWLYVAAPGGWEAPLVLGGRGALPVAGIGIRLEAGVELAAFGTAPDWPARVTTRFVPPEPARSADAPLRVWPAAQTAEFGPEAWAALFARVWRVSRQCDRVGYRLEGDPLAVPSAERVSEPHSVGSIQVARDGQPIVLMRDGPAVGGYAKIAVVDPDDLARLAQTRAGEAVRFAPAEPVSRPS